MVDWIRLHASNARGEGLIPGWRTKIPHVVKPKKKKKREHDSIIIINIFLKAMLFHVQFLLHATVRFGVAASIAITWFQIHRLVKGTDF